MGASTPNIVGSFYVEKESLVSDVCLGSEVHPLFPTVEYLRLYIRSVQTHERRRRIA